MGGIIVRVGQEESIDKAIRRFRKLTQKGGLQLRPRTAGRSGRKLYSITQQPTLGILKKTRERRTKANMRKTKIS